MAISTTPVNQASGYNTPQTITQPAAGNILICLLGLYGASPVPATPTCTNVAWSQITVITDSHNSFSIWLGIVSAGAGTSVSFGLASGSTSYYNNIITEWSGVNVTTTVDKYNTSNSSGSTVTLPTITDVYSNDLIIAGVIYDTSSAPSTTPSGYSALTGNSNGSQYLAGAYLVPASAGSQGGGTWSIGSVSWCCGLASIQVKPNYSSFGYITRRGKF